MRVYTTNSVQQPKARDAVSGSKAPHLSGIVRVIVATNDAKKARDTYGRGIGLTVTDVQQDDERGVLVAHATAPGGGALIELVSPNDEKQPFAAAIANHLSEHGEGMAALILSADNDDPKEAAKQLAARGLAFDLDGALGGPETTVFGTRIVIGTRKSRKSSILMSAQAQAQAKAKARL